MRLKRTPTWMTLWIAILLVVVAAGSQSRAPSPILAAPSTTPPTPQSSIYPRMPRISSTAGLLNVAAKPTNTPDLDVEYIGRTPHYKWCYVGVMNCSGVKQWPSAGETVTFEGRIANRGDVASGSFSYAWYIDGVLTSQASHATMAAGAEDVVRFNWTWATGAHTVKLVLDSTSVIPEVSEKNNSVEDRTNALTLGIYVEQAVYNYFNTNIWQADWDGNTSTLDGNSFDDWLQRQVSVWNKMFADAKYGLMPNGVIDRVRLDKVVRVTNGALQCQTNNPAGVIVTPVPPFQYGIDFEVDLIWGFPSGGVGVPSACDPNPGGFYSNPAYRYTWNIEPGLLHELSHARYLSDLYGFDIGATTLQLSAAVSANTTTLPLNDDPGRLLPFSPMIAPAYPIFDGEISACPSVSGNTLTNCTRGARGTMARSHLKDASVFGNAIYLLDGYGSALLGSAGLPLVGGTLFRDLYFDQDLMASGNWTGIDTNGIPHPKYNEHSAYAWNLLAGQRPTQGNANSPANIAAYLQAIPQSNIIQVRDTNGTPIANALVSVYLSKKQCYQKTDGQIECVGYGKKYEDPPDQTLCTDSQGQVSLGAYPFGRNSDGSQAVIENQEHAHGTLALKIIAANKVGVAFLEAPVANLAYWRGNQSQATYPITLSNWVTTATRYPACRYLPIIMTEPQSTNAQSSDTTVAAYPPPPTPAPYPVP